MNKGTRRDFDFLFFYHKNCLGHKHVHFILQMMSLIQMMFFIILLNWETLSHIDELQNKSILNKDFSTDL